MLSMVNGLLSLITLLMLVLISRATFLFRASPGGDGIKSPGLWGGEINVYENGTAQYLHQVGYGDLQLGEEIITELDISSISYDPISKRALMEIEDPKSDGGKIIASAAPCSSSSELEAIAGHVRLVDDDNKFLLEAKCGWKCGWNAFTYYDSQVYFVLSAVFGQHLGAHTTTREIHIRVLIGCEDLISAASHGEHVMDLRILQCSRHIITLHQQRYEWPNPTLSVWAGAAMTARKHDPNEPLQLFIQLFNKTTSGVLMTLLQVTLPETEDGQAKVTHLTNTLVPSIYSGTWQVRGLGEISHRDNVMCWTAAEQLLCGELHDDVITNVTPLLTSGEAYDAQICTGAVYPYPLGKIITGVALVSAKDPFAVFFGCFAEETGIGGLGLLLISASYGGASKQLFPVTSSGTKMYGGALFIIEDYHTECMGQEGYTRLQEPLTMDTTRGSGKTTTRGHDDGQGLDPCAGAVVGSGSDHPVSLLYPVLLIITVINHLTCHGLCQPDQF